MSKKLNGWLFSCRYGAKRVYLELDKDPDRNRICSCDTLEPVEIRVLARQKRAKRGKA